MAGSRSNRGQYGGGNVSGAKMWLVVGETEDSMYIYIYTYIYIYKSKGSIRRPVAASAYRTALRGLGIYLI